MAKEHDPLYRLENVTTRQWWQIQEGEKKQSELRKPNENETPAESTA